MDEKSRLRNPGVWMAFGVAATQVLVHGAFWPEGHLANKILIALGGLFGIAGSLFFGAGLQAPVVQKLQAWLLPLLIPAALLLASCASGLDGYRQAVSTSARVATATVATLQQVNDQAESALQARAAAAKTALELDQVKADRDVWRQRYGAARAAEASFELTLTAAQGAIALADAGQRSSVDLGKLIGDLVARAVTLKDMIAALIPAAPPKVNVAPLERYQRQLQLGITRWQVLRRGREAVAELLEGLREARVAEVQ